MKWKLKALAQFVIAHLPFGERLNHLAQLARGSFSPASQIRELLIQADYLRRLNERFPLAGTIVLEIGPGWRGTGTLTLYLFGVARIHAIDHQRHLRLPLMRGLIEQGLRNIDQLSVATGITGDRLIRRLRRIADCTTLDALLDVMNVTYHAPGDATRSGLADRSVDLIYSYGVLEHIPTSALEAIAAESVRILKASGRACHNIGLHDHFHTAGLGNGVNFLRYPEWKWAFFCHNKLLYHNRLRLPHYLEMFQRHGFKVAWMERELLEVNLAELKKLRVDKAFAHLSAEDLAASHLYVDLVH